MPKLDVKGCVCHGVLISGIWNYKVMINEFNLVNASAIQELLKRPDVIRYLKLDIS